MASNNLTTELTTNLADTLTVLPKATPVQDIGDWISQFGTRQSLLELAILVACGAIAWGLVWLTRRNLSTVADKSIFFGRRLVDGVLFPLILLALVYAARSVMLRYETVHLLNFAIPLVFALVFIRVTAKVLQAAFNDSPTVKFLERTISWAGWLALVLWLSGLLPLILQEMSDIKWKAGASQLNLRDLFEGILTAGAVLLLSLWVSSALEAKLLRNTSGSDLSLRKAASNALRAILIFVGLLVSLSLVGIDLTALSVLGGAVGVGIGLGLQKLAANYVSGFVILTERSMRIGDYVQVDGFEGRITDIKTRYTIIRSLGGRESIVPNEMLISNRVENMAFSDSHVNQQTFVSVGYDSDTALVKHLLIEIAKAQPRVLETPAPSAFLNKLGDHGLDFILSYWINDPENGQLNVRSDINMAILQALRENNIDIPYPQLVVHQAAKKAAENTVQT